MIRSELHREVELWQRWMRKAAFNLYRDLPNLGESYDGFVIPKAL